MQPRRRGVAEEDAETKLKRKNFLCVFSLCLRVSVVAFLRKGESDRPQRSAMLGRDCVHDCLADRDGLFVGDC